MNTLAVDLTESAWTEILDGNNSLGVQVETDGSVMLHFNNSTAPSLDAAAIQVQSFPPKWDFDCSQQTGQAKVWARAKSVAARVIVVRRTL